MGGRRAPAFGGLSRVDSVRRTVQLWAVMLVIIVFFLTWVFWYFGQI